jgi:ribosomal protein S18 acetylase RimI-like enzyme
MTMLIMPSVWQQPWLGRRVVVRRVVQGGLSDALGELIELGDDRLTVETRSGPITIARSDVATARLVLPAPREQFELEAVAASGWQASEVETSSDGWLLRADHGWTGRANSALALRTVSRRLDDVLAEVTAWYGERGLAPRVAVVLPAGAALAEALTQRQWTYAEEVDVLVSRLDLLQQALARPRPESGRTVHISAQPDQEWLTAYRYRGSQLPDAAIGVLRRHERVAFASIRDEHAETVATARGVVDNGWLGVTAVGVIESQRRRGLARATLSALVDWACSQQARRCYLQVSADNDPAQRLYAGLGFYQHHSYRYFQPPSI